MIDVDVRKIAQSLVENHGQRLAWQHAAAKALESASDGEVGIVWLAAAEGPAAGRTGDLLPVRPGPAGRAAPPPAPAAVQPKV